MSDCDACFFVDDETPESQLLEEALVEIGTDRSQQAQAFQQMKRADSNEVMNMVGTSREEQVQAFQQLEQVEADSNKVMGMVGACRAEQAQAIKQLNQAGEFIESSNVVGVFPDHGSRYMSKIYSDRWMTEQGFFDSDHAEDPKKVEYIQ